MKYLLLILLIPTIAKSQVSIQAGAGYKQSLAGHLSLSYSYKNIEGSVTMLSLPFRKQTFFSPNIGYVFQSNDWQIKTYAGPSYKLVGNKNPQDRYQHNGITETLSSGNEVNKWYGSFGLMAVKGVGFADVNYTNGFSISVGLRYTFNKE